jgi:hypothetical protein
VRPHLAQFVVWRERLPDAAAPLRVPGLGAISAALDMVLVPYDDYRRSPLRTSVDALGARLYYIVDGRLRTARAPVPGTLSLFDDPAAAADTVPPSYAPRVRQYATDAGTTAFNRFLEQLLRDDLNAAVFAAKHRGENETDAIEAFMDAVGLHDLLDLDTLKKSAWRMRTWRGAEIIRGKHLRPRHNALATPTYARPHW